MIPHCLSQIFVWIWKYRMCGRWWINQRLIEKFSLMLKSFQSSMSLHMLAIFSTLHRANSSLPFKLRTSILFSGRPSAFPTPKATLPLHPFFIVAFSTLYSIYCYSHRSRWQTFWKQNSLESLYSLIGILRVIKLPLLRGLTKIISVNLLDI